MKVLKLRLEKEENQMIFTPEVGSIFEVLGDAFLDLMKNAKFHKATFGVDTLWRQTWQAIEHEPS
jgi:hypothetical protein